MTPTAAASPSASSKPARGQPARVLEQVQVELPPDDRGDPERRDRFARQARDAAANEDTDLLRDAEEGVARARRALLSVSSTVQQSDDLLDEEGVAGGDLVQPRGDLVRAASTR